MHREYGGRAGADDRARARAGVRPRPASATRASSASRPFAARPRARQARFDATALAGADARRRRARPRQARRGAAPRRPATTTRPGPTTSAGCETAVRELEALLGQAGDAFGDQLRAALAASAAAPTIDDVLVRLRAPAAHEVGTRRGASGDASAQTAARVLARLELPAGAALPTELEALAREIVLAPTLERAEALATELRFAVQQSAHGARARSNPRQPRRRRCWKACRTTCPRRLLRALERVAAGVARLDDALRADGAERARRDRRRSRARRAVGRRRRADRNRLRDLGYEVDDIEATLFADGGTAHFRRAGWENYFVRLRVDPAGRSINFNVVRASGDEENAERRRQDALAEDRWCAEFPKLMQTLAARGLSLDVTRRLEAGAVPVQVVDAATLPAIAAEDDTHVQPRRRRASAMNGRSLHSLPGGGVSPLGRPCGMTGSPWTRRRAGSRTSTRLLPHPLAVRAGGQHPRQLPDAARQRRHARAASALPVGESVTARLPVPARVRSRRGPAPVSERARRGRAGDQALRLEACRRRDADEPREPGRRHAQGCRRCATRAARSSSISRRGSRGSPIISTPTSIASSSPPSASR